MVAPEVFVRGDEDFLKIPDCWLDQPAERLAGNDPGEGVLEECPELIVEVVSRTDQADKQQPEDDGVDREWCFAGMAR